MTARSFPRLDEDSRLVPILNNLSGGFLAGVTSEWNAPSEGELGKITADMIDELSRKHFPMCMRTLHDNLRKDHHLKHFGRLQYGLFLKVSITAEFRHKKTSEPSKGPGPFYRGSRFLLEEII